MAAKSNQCWRNSDLSKSTITRARAYRNPSEVRRWDQSRHELAAVDAYDLSGSVAVGSAEEEENRFGHFVGPPDAAQRDRLHALGDARVQFLARHSVPP